VPVEADSVDSPEVLYAPGTTAIYFTTDDEMYGRVTFEGLDSIRVSRGEYGPYEDDWQEGTAFCWVFKVENSSWLKERYAYESKHYGNAYGFGGDVDEMLTDYSHYLFTFHDQFVEALAAGVWFEKSETPLAGEKYLADHPFHQLNTTNIERFEAHGLVCQARRNLNSEKHLVDAAQYCSQKLIEFAPELDGTATTSITLSLRYRSGKLVSLLSQQFGGQMAEFEGVASLDDARPYIDSWLGEVSERRREMGK